MCYDFPGDLSYVPMGFQVPISMAGKQPGDETEWMISSSQGSEHTSPAGTVELYLSLADMSARQDERAREVRFLFLAAREAQQTGFAEVADICRTRLLEQNPDHPLRRFATMAEAMTDRDVITYGNELAEIYPPPKAEHLLHKYQASGFAKSPLTTSEVSSIITPPIESPAAANASLVVPAERVRKKKKKPSVRKSKAVLIHEYEESASTEVPISSANSELEPLPFEWPQSPKPIAWRPHPILLLITGIAGGFVAGVWASPTLLPWILRTWSQFQQ